jgi:aminoglycoside/choline kinase family phosphotransferase
MIETQAFLARHGYGRARRTPLAGDASARRYERLTGGPTPAILMHSPPQIGVEPFRSVARWLHACGMSAPEIIAADAEIGQVLLEDLGDDLFSRVLARDGDEANLYAAAVDLLIDLQRRPPPPDLPAYDDAKLLAMCPHWKRCGSFCTSRRCEACEQPFKRFKPVRRGKCRKH